MKPNDQEVPMSSPITRWPAVPITNSELRELHSSIVGQDYLIKVRLPEAYAASTTAYPVLYLPDGDHWFAMATDIVQYLIYGQHVPDLIIASTAYGAKEPPQNMRGRDLLPFPTGWTDLAPGAEQYLQFLEHELIPFVESNYRVDSTNRTLAGYSAGSLFVLWSLFTRPGLFQRAIAVDGFHDRLSALEEEYAATHRSMPARLFIGWCHENFAQFVARLESRSYEELSLDSARLASQEHFQVPGDGLARGLVSVFR
jgi:hypothetical protein